MIQLTENVWAVSVPEDASNITIIPFDERLSYEYNIKYWEDGRTGEIKTIKLLPGNWEFICTSAGATEEQAASIVGKISGIFPAVFYKCYDMGADFHFKPSDSLASLLRSKGLEGNYALLRKL